MQSINNQQAFEALTQGARILEQDHFGIKVMRLPDDRILKLFRRKRLLSSQIWSPLAVRFKQNSEALIRRGIPTVQIDQIFELPHLHRQAVLYQALPGSTLRDWIDQRADEAVDVRQQIEAYGAFVAQLHDCGILFRSLHLGNVLVTNDGTLALIDIADMTLRRSGALSTSQRKRNFKHITRYPIDRKHLLKAGVDIFANAYFNATCLSAKVQWVLEQGLKRQLSATTR